MREGSRARMHRNQWLETSAVWVRAFLDCFHFYVMVSLSCPHPFYFPFLSSSESVHWVGAESVGSPMIYLLSDTNLPSEESWKKCLHPTQQWRRLPPPSGLSPYLLQSLLRNRNIHKRAQRSCINTRPPRHNLIRILCMLGLYPGNNDRLGANLLKNSGQVAS